MWKNIVDWGRPQMTTWSMRISCWVPKATNTHTHTHTHTGCLILIAFPQQQWLHERASMLRYTYSALPVLSVVCHHSAWKLRFDPRE